MGAITPVNENEASGSGNRVIKTCTVASLATGDTWATGMTPHQVFVSNMTETQAVVASISSGTITFTVTAGPVTNAHIMVVGEP